MRHLYRRKILLPLIFLAVIGFIHIHSLEMFVAARRLFLLFSFLKVIRRLRERAEPIRLFAESDEEACQRLRFVVIRLQAVTS